MTKLTEQLIVRGLLAALVTLVVFFAYGLAVEPTPRTVIDLGHTAELFQP